MSSATLFGGVEAGGTKFLCAVCDDDGQVLDTLRIVTTTPAETLGTATTFFRSAARTHGALSALGIGSFGPLALDPDAPEFGTITSTPKAGWQGVDILGHLRAATGVPTVLDTDVNCAATSERLFGAGRGRDTFCYVTVGTGIGVSVMIGGVPHGGANHPEAGHIMLPHAPGDVDFAGICPFHGDCLEGLASGPAMRARWGVPAETLPTEHRAWSIEADYVATLCATLTYIVRPSRIILGGGVMQPAMYNLVRAALDRKLAGYDASVRSLDLADYVVAPGATPAAGLTGALALAYRAATRKWPLHWSVAAPSDSRTEDLHA